MKVVELLTDIGSKELTDNPALLERDPILPRDGAFDGVCELVKRFFACRAAVVHIVDREGALSRAWPDGGQSDERMASFSAAVDGADLRDDVRALANPLLAGEQGLRFYAGIPLRTDGGHDMGVLAALDTDRRQFSDSDLESLKLFARIVVENLDCRIAASRAISL